MAYSSHIVARLFIFFIETHLPLRYRINLVFLLLLKDFIAGILIANRMFHRDPSASSLFDPEPKPKGAMVGMIFGAKKKARNRQFFNHQPNLYVKSY